MSWQLLIAVSIITSSVSILLQRILMHKDKSDPIAYTIVFQGLAAFLIGIFAIIHGFHMPDVRQYWFPILVTFVLYGVGNVVYAKTLQHVEASIFSILLATNTMWFMLMGYFIFQEHLSTKQLLGALLIFASIGMLAERSGKLKFDKGILFGLLTGFLLGLATVAWVYVGKHSDTASWLALGCAGTSLVVILTNPKSVIKIKPFLSGGILIKMLLLVVLLSSSNGALLMAYQYGKTSIVAPLQQASLILTILLAVIFLNERTRLWQKAIAATICFLGVLLITII